MNTKRREDGAIQVFMEMQFLLSLWVFTEAMILLRHGRSPLHGAVHTQPRAQPAEICMDCSATLVPVLEEMGGMRSPDHAWLLQRMHCFRQAGREVQGASSPQQQVEGCRQLLQVPSQHCAAHPHLKAADKGRVLCDKVLFKGTISCRSLQHVVSHRKEEEEEGKGQRNMFQPGSRSHHLHFQHSQPARMETRGVSPSS